MSWYLGEPLILAADIDHYLLIIGNYNIAVMIVCSVLALVMIELIFVKPTNQHAGHNRTLQAA